MSKRQINQCTCALNVRSLAVEVPQPSKQMYVTVAFRVSNQLLEVAQKQFEHYQNDYPSSEVTFNDFCKRTFQRGLRDNAHKKPVNLFPEEIK